MKTNWKQPNIPKRITAKFEWSAPYAAAVYSGPHFKDGSRGIPRPWVDVAIARSDLSLLLKAAFRGDLIAAFLLMVEQMQLEFAEVIDSHDWGVIGDGEKRYRGGPTWQYITDSGELRDSLEVSIDVQR